METVQNVAATAQSAATTAYTTASKLIFGENQNTESGQEPVSGQQGQGSAASPFDQGNGQDGAAAGQGTASGTVAAVQQRQESGQEPLSGVQGSGTVDEPFDQGNAVDGAAAGQGAKDTVAASSSSGAVSGGPVEAGSGAGLTEASAPLGEVKGAGRPADEPVGGQQDAVKAPKDAAEDAIGTNVVDNTAQGGNDLSGEAIKAKATGDQYPKSTGLAADGGDFDASKPGAGAEATRLLDERSADKAVDTQPDAGPEESDLAGEDGAKGKPRLRERIKDKLHIHKH